MRTFPVAKYLHLAMTLENIIACNEPDATSKQPLDAATRQTVHGFFGDYINELPEYEFKASLVTAEKAFHLAHQPSTTYEDLFPLVKEFQGRLIDEASKTVFFTINAAESAHYSSPRLKWEEIITRFPITLDDIEEARKCLALSRYAAAVFHSVQIVEHGMIALGEFMKVKDHLPGFTATTRELTRVLKLEYKDRDAFQRRHFVFFEQVNAEIAPLQAAWRNKISHAEGKLTLLTADFHPDVAEEIVMATRGLMRRLATDLPS